MPSKNGAKEFVIDPSASPSIKNSVVSKLCKWTLGGKGSKIADQYPSSYNQSYRLPDYPDKYIYRNAMFKDQMRDRVEHADNIVQLLLYAGEKYADQPFHGTRTVLETVTITTDDKRELKKCSLTDFVWASYKQIIMQNCHYLAAFFIHQGLSSTSNITILADTHSEWAQVEYAVILTGYPLMIIYPTLSDEAIIYACELTDTVSIFVDQKCLNRMISTNKNGENSLLANMAMIKTVYCASDCTEDQINTLKSLDINVFTFQSMLESGKELVKTVANPNNSNTDKKEGFRAADNVTGDSVICVMFTSGSTGMPKGVMIQHKNLLATLAGATYRQHLWEDVTFAAYLPLSHNFEFLAELALAYNGAKIGYCRPLTLTDNSPMLLPNTKGDFTLLEPNFCTFVPLLLERLKKGIIENVKQKGAVTCALIEFAFNEKKKCRKTGHNASDYIDSIILNKIKRVVSKNLRCATIGSAPLSEDTEEFVTLMFGCQMKQGYGLTETCSGGTFADINDLTYGNTGPPLPCNELQLIAWEEGGYSPEDKPNPRGEILLSGRNVTLGYYKQDELTDSVYKFDEETNRRWFYTGDIGELLPNGTIKIIDRKKDIIKLKHGEYVSLVQIEIFGMHSKYVDLLCALPNKDSDHIVLLVVPTRESVKNLLQKELKEEAKYDDLTETFSNERVREAIEKDLMAIFAKNKLHKFSVPKKIVLVREYWLPESGLMTPSMKVKRVEIAKFYSNHLD